MSAQDMQELYALVSWNSFKPKPALLLELAPILSEEMLSQAIGLALLIEDRPMRTNILTTLIDCIPEASREAVLEQKLIDARAIEQTDLQARALLGLIPFLSTPLLQQALEAAWAIKDKERRVEVLAAIIPSLSKPSRNKVLRQALKAVQTIEAEGNSALSLVN